MAHQRRLVRHLQSLGIRAQDLDGPADVQERKKISAKTFGRHPEYPFEVVVGGGHDPASALILRSRTYAGARDLVERYRVEALWWRRTELPLPPGPGPWMISARELVELPYPRAALNEDVAETFDLTDEELFLLPRPKYFLPTERETRLVALEQKTMAVLEQHLPPDLVRYIRARV